MCSRTSFSVVIAPTKKPITTTATNAKRELSSNCNLFQMLRIKFVISHENMDKFDIMIVDTVLGIAIPAIVRHGFSIVDQSCLRMQASILAHTSVSNLY